MGEDQGHAPLVARVRQFNNKKKPDHWRDVFLSTVNGGRTVKAQTVYRQGDPADAVFYIQTGKVKITVISDQGKPPERRIVPITTCAGLYVRSLL